LVCTAVTNFSVALMFLETHRRACTMFQPRSCTFILAYKARTWRGRQDGSAHYKKFTTHPGVYSGYYYF